MVSNRGQKIARGQWLVRLIGYDEINSSWGIEREERPAQRLLIYFPSLVCGVIWKIKVLVDNCNALCYNNRKMYVYNSSSYLG